MAERKERPDGNAQSACQVSGGASHTHHQIQGQQRRGRVPETGWIKRAAEIGDGKVGGFDLFGTGSDLEAEQTDSRQYGKGLKLRQLDRAMLVIMITSMSLP